MSTDAKQVVNNPRGTPIMQTKKQMNRRQLMLNTWQTTREACPYSSRCMWNAFRLPMCCFSRGTAMHGRTTMDGTRMHGCPPYRNSINRCKRMLNIRQATQSVQRYPFQRRNRLPMCSFLWGTAMHERTLYALNPHVQLSAQLKRTKQFVAYAEHMVNNPRGMLPTHLDAFERRDRLPMCGFWWGTAMHGWTPVHEALL